MTMRFNYSKWDGSQNVEDLDAASIFDQLSDSLLYNGDVSSALRELMSKGFTRPDGTRVDGLSEMIDNLRSRRSQLLGSYDLSSVYESIAGKVGEVIEEEIAAIDASEASPGGISSDVANGKRLELSALPDDLPGRMRGLRGYDFVSESAKMHFEKLVEELRNQLIESNFSQMKQALGQTSPADMQRMTQMLGALNQLLEKRAAGQDSSEDFQEFMDEFGDMLPQVASLDELLEVMARQAEAMSSFMASLDPEQRAELASLFSDLLADLDLGWQLDRLGSNLNQLGFSPGGQQFGFRGDQSMSLGEAGEMFSELSAIDSLEAFLRNPSNPGALAEVDLDQVSDMLGPDAAKSLKELAKLAKSLEEGGLIDQREGYLRISPKGLRRIADKALNELFKRLDGSGLGEHQATSSGYGVDLEYQTKPYEYGDNFNLSIERTLRNASMRQGQSTPIRLSPEDFEIERTEQLLSSATVLLLDLSLSMPLRDNFLPAKKVAVALSSLISSKFPRDYFSLIGFSEVARELTLAELPTVTWDYVYGTNIQHALALARVNLKGRDGNRQILLVTDGEPTAHVMEDGEVFFSYPPAAETLQATLAEVRRCTKERIVINSFVLDANDYLKRFMDKMISINGGRVFYTSSDELGDFVLVDFLKQRR